MRSRVLGQELLTHTQSQSPLKSSNPRTSVMAPAQDTLARTRPVQKNTDTASCDIPVCRWRTSLERWDMSVRMADHILCNLADLVQEL